MNIVHSIQFKSNSLLVIRRKNKRSFWEMKICLWPYDLPLETIFFFFILNRISCAVFDHTTSDILNSSPITTSLRETRSIVISKDGKTGFSFFLPHLSSGDAKEQWNGHNADPEKEWAAAWSMGSHRKWNIFPWIITI